MLTGKKWGPPIVCNDGVTIARELELKDLDEDLGVRMIRQAVERTGDVVGDGTSTSTLLAHAIYADGVRNVEAGASAIGIKRGLDRGLRAAVAAIQRISQPVTGRLTPPSTRSPPCGSNGPRRGCKDPMRRADRGEHRDDISRRHRAGARGTRDIGLVRTRTRST